METEQIQLPTQIMDSIRTIIKQTNLFQDESDFVQQAVMKQLTKFKNI